MIIEGKNHNEFTEDVLATLQRRKVTFRGCEPHYVEIKLDGSVSVEFFGLRDNKPYKGSVKFNCPFPSDKLMLADPAVVAEICEKGIALMGC